MGIDPKTNAVCPREKPPFDQTVEVHSANGGVRFHQDGVDAYSVKALLLEWRVPEPAATFPSNILVGGHSALAHPISSPLANSSAQLEVEVKAVGTAHKIQASGQELDGTRISRNPRPAVRQAEDHG